jgi:phospholipase/lecithinase/hemolysin
MFRIPDTAQVLKSRRQGVAVAACLAMTALVAGCGGGDRVKSFQPSQIIAFGDESSAFDDTSSSGTPLVTSNGVAIAGSRYTINVLSTGTQGLCVDAACTSSTVPATTAIGTVFNPTTVTYTNVFSGNPKVVHLVEEGTFVDASAPATLYRVTDFAYECSATQGSDYGNWVQILTQGMGGGALTLGGATGCPLDGGNGRSYAAWGAKIDDVAAQVNGHLGELRDGVLVTMLAGQNDIMAAYDRVRLGTQTADDAQKLMRDKGAQLAGIITQIVGTGARVVYLTVPNLGVLPKVVANGDPGLATALTHAFNEGYQGSGEGNESGGLVLSVKNDGHKIVKVDGYNLIASLAPSYANIGVCENDLNKATGPDGQLLKNVYPTITTDADLKAKVLLLNCTSANLKVVTERNVNVTPPVDEVRYASPYYLWADDQHLTPLGHAALANLAVARIRDQL